MGPQAVHHTQIEHRVARDPDRVCVVGEVRADHAEIRAELVIDVDTPPTAVALAFCVDADQESVTSTREQTDVPVLEAGAAELPIEIDSGEGQAVVELPRQPIGSQAPLVGIAERAPKHQAELPDFGRSLVSSDPAQFTKTVADRTYYVLFEFTRVTDFIEWIGSAPVPGESGLRSRLHAALQPVAEYVLAAMQVTQVFSVRLAVLALAMPVFVMFTLIAIADGLVKRDLRRWGEGRESSFVYHWAKRSALPLLVLIWVIYLALPFSLHPSFVVLPFALSVAVTASSFKKYL